MTVKKFRKKPVVIEAVQLTDENIVDTLDWVGFVIGSDCGDYITIQTLEGEMVANIGDFIIKGVNGEFYPCKPDIFMKTYDEA